MSRRPTTTTSSAPPRVRHVAAIDHDTNAVLHCLRLVVRSQEFVKMAVRRFVHRSKVVQRFARRIVRGRQALTAAALDALGHEEATVNPGELRALWGASGCGTPSHEVRLLTIVSMYHKQRAAFRARWRAWREATEAAAERLRCEEARMRVRRRRDGGGGEQQQQRCSLEAARYDLVQPLRQRLAQVRGLRPHFALEATLAQVLAEHTSLQRRKLVTAVLQTMRGLNLEATDPHVVATLLRRYEKEADAAEEAEAAAAAAADAAVAPAGTGDAAASFLDDDDARAEGQLPATSGSGLRFDRSLGSASALHPAALGASITVGTTASASGVGVGCAPVFHTAKEEDTRRVFGVYALSPDDTRPTPAVPAVGAAVVAPTVPSPSPASPPAGGFCLPLRLVEKGCWGWAADAPSSAAAAAAAASTAARPSSSAAGSATAAARRRLRRLRRAPPRRVVKETRAMRVRRVKEAAAAAVGAASDKSNAEQRAAAEEEEEVEEEAQAATSAYLPDNRLCAVLLESTAKTGRHRKDKVVYTQAALRTSPQPPTPTPPPPAAASDAAASASAPAPSPLHLTREALLCSARARRYACNMTRRCAAFGADACGASPAEQNALAAVVAAAVPAAAAAAAAAAETLAAAATAADAAAASEPPQQASSSSSSPEEGAGGGGGGGCGAGAAEYRPLEAAEVRRRLADGVCLAATLDDVEFMSAVDALVGAEERQRARRCLERSGGGGGGGGDGSDDASEAQDLRVNPYFACPASGRSAAARAAAAAAAAAESRRRRRRETAGMEHTVCLNKAHYARAAFMWERKKKKAAAAAAATKSGWPQSAAAAPRPPLPPEAATAGGSWGHSCSPRPAGMAKRRMRAAQRILSPRAPVVLTPDGSSYHYHRFYDAEAREQPWGKRLR